MTANKNIDKICVAVMLVALIITALFMAGTKLGIEPVVDMDAESYDGPEYVTANDLNGAWDTSDATVISLNEDTAQISGNGAYVNGSDVVISNGGHYVISGTLTNGRIIIDSFSSSKIWIMLDNVSLYCENDACIRIEEADKVFLTLAEGSVNTVSGGESYSETAVEDGAEAVIFSHDDLTINGSGTLSINAGYKHGIKANDDFVLAGVTVNITASQDAVHVNEDVSIVNAHLTIDAGDDAITTDGTINVENSDILINNCYEGLEAEYINVYSGNIEIYPSDDGFNAAGGSVSGFGFGAPGGTGGGPPDFGGASEDNVAGSDKNTDDAVAEQADSNAVAPAEDSSKQANSDMATATDDSNKHADSDMTAPAEDSSKHTDIDMATATDNSSKHADNNVATPTDSDGKQADRNMETPTDDGDAQTDSSQDEESEELPYIKIYDGNITIINENAMDSDGLDSNGDIYIYGGNVFISLKSSGPSNAIDYGSESGGVCVIEGGTVIACGSYTMAEGFDSSSTQASIMYTISEGVEAGSTISVETEDEETLLSAEIPCDFSCAVLSCPEMKVGESYLVALGDQVDDITIEEISSSFGDAQSSGFGGPMNFSDMMSRDSFRQGHRRGPGSNASSDDSEASEDSFPPDFEGMEPPDFGDAPPDFDGMEPPDFGGSAPDFEGMEPPDSSSDSERMSPPDMPGGMSDGMPGEPGQETKEETTLTFPGKALDEYNSTTWIELAISLAALTAGLLFAKRYRRR